MRKRQISIALLLLCYCTAVFAQQPNYDAAKKYDAPQLGKLVGSLKLVPFFLKKTNSFWFVSDRPQLLSESTVHLGDNIVSVTKRSNSIYYIVDMATGQKQELFDQSAIHLQLKKEIGDQFDDERVTYMPSFSEDEQKVQVKYLNQLYDYDYKSKQLKKRLENLPLDRKNTKIGVSPNGKWELYTRAHNLYMGSPDDRKIEQQLSSDASPYYSFCVDEKGDYMVDKTFPSVAQWINDRFFYAMRVDRRKVATMSVINSGATARPRVSTYKYETPGDKDVAQFELFIGDSQTKAIKKINLERWPDQQLEVVASPGNATEIFVLRRKRTRDEMELCAVDLFNGNVRTIIHEVSKPFINEDFFNVYIIKSGKEIIWWSDRSGWGQYYRYNAQGKLLNRITKGNFTAGKILLIDTAKSSAYLYAYGKQPKMNPYYATLYKVSFDGKAEKLLTPENATHQVSMSPNRNYFVDNYSRIDLPPVTVLRKIDGTKVAEVFKPDVSALYNYGWKHAEAFTVKAKDDSTTLYGLIWKPFDFDPNKKYPVISQVYPGPQIETVWNDFTVLDRYNNTALAQLGFIVVAVGHRGGSPIRNAAYYKYGYGNLRDNAIDDDKYALEQLAERYSYLDLSRVGIFGHSGGGMMTVAAMAKYPDFYKVGVASSGNHDNRIYNRTWGESYQGFENKMQINQDLAKNIKGNLMLVTGEVDENVNPAHTFRMADALIKADKDFDLMVLPGQGHSYEGAAKSYFHKRLRAYFAKYLIAQPIDAVK